jgi:hypothetical protein
MSDFSRDQLDVLAGARRGLGPNAQDAARVLHKARLAIGSGVVPAAEAGLAGGAAKSATAGVLAKHVASWLAVAGIAAWLGYHAGFSYGEQSARQASVGAREIASPAPAPEPPLAAVSAAAPVESKNIAGESPSERAAEPKRKPKPAAQPMLVPEAPDASQAVAPVAPQPNASLDAEIKALRFVERALRNREPKTALTRLAQLDRDVPQGQMLEERAAARAMARCDARALEAAPDRVEVMQRVLEFSQQFPASVYFARVRQTCLATIDRDAATD